MAVTDEVDLADPQQVDRRQRLAAPHDRRDVLPARAHPARGRAEAAVELTRAVDAADDRVQRDDLQPDPAFGHEPERGDDLLVGEHHPDVVGLAPQPRVQT